jgi:hypothetical protein
MAKSKKSKKPINNSPYVSPLREVYLKQVITPKAYESTGTGWVNYGIDAPYKNLYPQFLISMYNGSATHRAITDAASNYIAGKGILIEDNKNIEATSKLNLFLKNINSKETIEELLSKVAKDLYLQGAIALNVIYSNDKKSVASITHIPVEKIRIGKPNANGIVEEYWISSDWSNIRKKENEPKAVPAFNPYDRSNTNQLLYVRDYTPGLDLYGSPSYASSTNWILTDSLVSEYHYNNTAGGFSPTTWINFNSGQPTEEEQQIIENAITRKMTGVGGKKMILTFTDEGVNTPDIQNLALSDASQQYLALNELVIQNLMIGHRVVSPSLMGVKTPGELGGKNEILEAYELYSRSVIQPYQDIIVKTLSKIFEINGINIPFSIKDVSPFANKFGSEILEKVMTTTEIRQELGLEPLEATEEVVDANTSLKKDISLDELESLLDGLGEFEEDLTKEYDILAIEDTEDENEEDDYEAQLNNRTDLADVKDGNPKPNKVSNQDGTSKQTEQKGNKFRVRYKYSGSQNPQRAFCKLMVRKANSGLVYRKSDILAMSRMAVNPGWGPGGKNTYSIWLNNCYDKELCTKDLHKFYKGGGACKHKWVRVIFVQKKGERASKNNEIIGTSEARRRGFKPVPNKETDWAVRPSDMPNKGFINK